MGISCDVAWKNITFGIGTLEDFVYCNGYPNSMYLTTKSLYLFITYKYTMIHVIKLLGECYLYDHFLTKTTALEISLICYHRSYNAQKLLILVNYDFTLNIWLQSSCQYTLLMKCVFESHVQNIVLIPYCNEA